MMATWLQGATGLDSEISKDCGTFADCTNEATQIATSSGMYYLDLTGTETAARVLSTITKTTSTDAKTTPIVQNVIELPVVASGTAQAGGATSITLASSASDENNYYVGCYVRCSNNTPSNVLGQARLITAYNGSTKVATVATWGTNPSSSTTYEILAGPDWIRRPSDAVMFSGDSSVADRMELLLESAEIGTVDTAAFTPTTTEFETTTTEATADHFNNQALKWGAGAVNAGLTCRITDYVLTGGKGHFTVTALPAAPAASDPYIILGRNAGA